MSEFKDKTFEIGITDLHNSELNGVVLDETESVKPFDWWNDNVFLKRKPEFLERVLMVRVSEQDLCLPISASSKLQAREDFEKILVDTRHIK